MEYSLVIVPIKFPLNATDAFNGNHKALMKVQTDIVHLNAEL